MQEAHPTAILLSLPMPRQLRLRPSGKENDAWDPSYMRA